MDLQHWLTLFKEQVKQTSLMEWASVSFSVAEVLLAKVNNVWLYPTGIIGILLGTYILLDVGLYAESILNAYYLIMSIYGWWYWIKRRNEPPVKISMNNKQDWAITLLIVFVGWGVLYLLLKNFTDSTVPIWDAWVSSTAWAGMWLLARRKLENWILLNVSNLFAIPLLWHKQLVLFAALTLFLFIVAIFGFFDWRKIYRKEKANA